MLQRVLQCMLQCVSQCELQCIALYVAPIEQRQTRKMSDWDQQFLAVVIIDPLSPPPVDSLKVHNQRETNLVVPFCRKVTESQKYVDTRKE